MSTYLPMYRIQVARNTPLGVVMAESESQDTDANPRPEGFNPSAEVAA